MAGRVGVFHLPLHDKCDNSENVMTFQGSILGLSILKMDYLDLFLLIFIVINHESL